MKVVILAGGSGSRLWPVSRKDVPKQSKPILKNQTLLLSTYKRLLKGFSPRDIYVATNINQVGSIKEQLPELKKSNLIAEPDKKDTAAAIGLAATILAKKNPREIFININSDHHIKNEEEYVRIIKLAEKTVKKYPDTGVLIGVKPNYPETGYGYIKMGKQATEIDKTKIFVIEAFKEKPDIKTAEEYVKQWEYLWNIGCFAWRADTLLTLYEKFLPSTYRILMRIQKSLGTKDEDKIIKREFSKIKPISVDYGIIEKAPKLNVIPADFGWADVGHWRTVKDILCPSKKKSVTIGKVMEIESEDNLIYNYSDKLIATVGVKGMVLIETNDAILLCPKDKAQDVKQIVKKLKEEGLTQYL